MDLNMENKVARLARIKMEMQSDRVHLNLVFRIRDGESGAVATAQSNRAGGRPLYHGLEMVNFRTQFR